MRNEMLSLLCDPFTHESLTLDIDGSLSGAGRRYPLRDGIPVFVTDEDLTGLNGRYEAMYRWITPGRQLALPAEGGFLCGPRPDLVHAAAVPAHGGPAGPERRPGSWQRRAAALPGRSV